MKIPVLKTKITRERMRKRGSRPCVVTRSRDVPARVAKGLFQGRQQPETCKAKKIVSQEIQVNDQGLRRVRQKWDSTLDGEGRIPLLRGRSATKPSMSAPCFLALSNKKLKLRPVDWKDAEADRHINPTESATTIIATLSSELSS